MKVQIRNVDLLHENIKILQNELAQKNEISYGNSIDSV